MKEQFLKRLPETAKEERALVEAAFGIPDTVRGKASDIRGNAHLSPIGQQEQIRAMASGAPLGHLRQIRSRAAGMTADVANLRKAIAPPAPDRSDLFGESQRAELRAFVRSLPEGKRLRAVMDDPSLTEAVLLAHPALSGLSTNSEDGAPSQFDLVRDKYLETKFGAQLHGIEAREEVLANLNAAIAIATQDFCRETGIEPEEIEK